MNNPFDYVPDEACDGAIRELTSRLELLRKSPNSADDNFISELDDGKMLGVLIATDQNGTDHKLYAFPANLDAVVFIMTDSLLLFSIILIRKGTSNKRKLIFLVRTERQISLRKRLYAYCCGNMNSRKQKPMRKYRNIKRNAANQS